MVASVAMSEAAERPAWRISFRTLGLVVLALATVAVLGGRYILGRYGGYRPLALAHVPQTMRYRARVELHDQARAEAIRPLLTALDPRSRRIPYLERTLGISFKEAGRELAFGVGPDPFDYVVVLGLQLQAGTGIPAAKALCESVALDGIRSEPTESGCRLPGGGLLAGTPDGAVVLASKAELVKGLLGVPDLGDRLGFSGPSVRGVAPETGELGREASTLAQRIQAAGP
jgi:hypothetical protein